MRPRPAPGPHRELGERRESRSDGLISRRSAIPTSPRLDDLLRLGHLRQVLPSAVVVETEFGRDGLGRSTFGMSVEPAEDSLPTFGEMSPLIVTDDRPREVLVAFEHEVTLLGVAGPDT